MTSAQCALLLTQAVHFITYFQSRHSDHVTVYDNLVDLVNDLESESVKNNPYLFVFIDESVISKSNFESVLKQLHDINPTLHFLLSCSNLDEVLFDTLQAATDSQVMFIDKAPRDIFLQQAIMQITQLAEQQSLLETKKSQIETVRQKLYIRDKLFNNLLSVIKFDLKGKIVSVNRHGTIEMGWRHARLLGKSIHDVVLWSNDGSGIVQYFETFSGETRYFDGEGRQKWAFAQVKKVKEEDGDYFYFVGKDITEQKQFARRLQYENYQEGMLKAKSDLIHDIGNTLNSMNATYGVLVSGVEQLKGVAQYIERWSEEKQSLSLPVETSYNFIEAIEHSCQFILDKHFAKTTLALKNDLALLIDAVGSKRQVLPIENTQKVVNLYNLVQEVILSTQALLSEKEITVQVLDVDPTIFLKVSHNQLFQVVLNLIKNAVEAIELSDKSDRLITLQSCQNDGEIQLEVQDTAGGIAPKDLKKIFNYGFTTKEGGSGHGLHSVANFMNKNGGKVEVESSKESGTRFTLTFPVSLFEALPET